MTRSIDNIRNFCIIAHIDHGKSTLADRLIQSTGGVELREFREQLLDNMDLERERGITIKASAARLGYTANDGRSYVLNLIDTPGHVDFTYEVTKSLAACEGAILVVDASQGVEAQTVANLRFAQKLELKIIPVMNKVDLSNAEPDKVAEQMTTLLEIEENDIILASAKEGMGIQEILEALVDRIPPPVTELQSPLKALIFDSAYDPYRGVVIFLRVFDGELRPGANVTFIGTKNNYEIQEIGVLTPKVTKKDLLRAGEVGYIICNIKEAREVIIGDTITETNRPCTKAIAGFKEPKPMVFSGIYPVNSKDFNSLREAVEKLRLSDASFFYQVESSSSMGFGFRCGFLGLLHMEIIHERLEREYNLNLIITNPSVVYRVKTTGSEHMDVDSATKMPQPDKIESVFEPYAKVIILTPVWAIGSVMDFVVTRRAAYVSTEYISEERAKLLYDMPLVEIIIDFYDKIKSLTSGYGSMDYELTDYKKADVVKLDILINGDVCDALSSLVAKEKAYYKGRALVEKMKEYIPRQMFEVVIQAAIGGKIIARESVKPYRKQVTSKCYGGDITRKRKLWEKQKEGKKKMKRFGKVEIPQEAFMAALKTS